MDSVELRKTGHVTDANSVLDDESKALRSRIAVLEQEVARLRLAVDMIETLERYRDSILQRHPDSKALELARSVVLEAREFITNAAGFHYLEFAEDGTAFRWTGPEHQSRLIFWIDRSRPLRLKLETYSLGRVREGSRMFVEVDRQRLSATVKLNERMLTFGPIVGREAPGPTEVVIESPVVFCPAQDGSPDTRHLGIAITRVELSPL
jgi:hypothetical protein